MGVWEEARAYVGLRVGVTVAAPARRWATLAGLREPGWCEGLGIGELTVWVRTLQQRRRRFGR